MFQYGIEIMSDSNNPPEKQAVVGILKEETTDPVPAPALAETYAPSNNEASTPGLGKRDLENDVDNENKGNKEISESMKISSSSKKSRYVPSPGLPERDPSGYPLRNIAIPHVHDVLCGRGGGTNSHPGNTFYRNVVSDEKSLYLTCAKKEKVNVSKKIVDKIRKQNPPGRFLAREDDNGLWHDIGDKKAVEKTAQALREGAPDIREVIVKNPLQPIPIMPNPMMQYQHYQHQPMRMQHISQHVRPMQMNGTVMNQPNTVKMVTGMHTGHLQHPGQQQQHPGQPQQVLQRMHYQPHHVQQQHIRPYMMKGVQGAVNTYPGIHSEQVGTGNRPFQIHPGQRMHHPVQQQQQQHQYHSSHSGSAQNSQQQLHAINHQRQEKSQDRQQQPQQIKDSFNKAIIQSNVDKARLLENSFTDEHKQNNHTRVHGAGKISTDSHSYHDLLQNDRKAHASTLNSKSVSDHQKLSPVISQSKIDENTQTAGITTALFPTIGSSSLPCVENNNQCRNNNQDDNSTKALHTSTNDEIKKNTDEDIGIPSNFQIVHDNTHNKINGPPSEIEVVHNGVVYHYVLKGNNIQEPPIIRITSQGSGPFRDNSITWYSSTPGSIANPPLTQLVSSKSLTGGFDDDNSTSFVASNGGRYVTENARGSSNDSHPVQVTTLAPADTWSGMSDVAMTILNSGPSLGSGSLLVSGQHYGQQQQPQTIVIQQPPQYTQQQQHQQYVYHTNPLPQEQQYTTMEVYNYDVNQGNDSNYFHQGQQQQYKTQNQLPTL